MSHSQYRAGMPMKLFYDAPRLKIPNENCAFVRTTQPIISWKLDHLSNTWAPSTKQNVAKQLYLSFLWPRKVLTQLPEIKSHIRIAESMLLASTNFPFGENCTHDTGGLFSSTKVFKHCPVKVSQNRLRVSLDGRRVYINPSCPHETINVPSGEKSTAVTGSLCAGS